MEGATGLDPTRLRTTELAAAGQATAEWTCWPGRACLSVRRYGVVPNGVLGRAVLGSAIRAEPILSCAVLAEPILSRAILTEPGLTRTILAECRTT